MEWAVVAGAVVVAVAAWLLLFGGRRDDIWPRTWGVAAVLIATSTTALAALGRLGEVIGPVGPPEVLAGVLVGVAWLVATHVGHAVLCRLFPSFVEQIRDLYGLGADDPARRVLGPILAMALAEELLFRGVVHTLAGFAAGVAVYGAVQVIERKWALVLAAVLGGIVWGGLYELTGGIVAPVVAHAIWTASLTLVWPLRGCGDAPPVSPATPATRA
jgi:membrane protease YdiL (CAAX protease family)